MNEVKEEVKETEEKKEEVKKDETTEKTSKSFTEIIGSIWNSKPVRVIRKVTKWTLITGTALIGVTGAAKAGCTMALEEHDMKDSEDSPEETTEEIPDEIPDEIPGDSDSETE
jgi:hypothetical protein